MTTTTYQVGQRIAYSTSSNYYTPRFENVLRVTPTTIVTETGRRFSIATQREMKCKLHPFPSAYLTSVTVAEEHIIERKQDQETSKQVRELIDFAEGCRSGDGIRYITAEYKEKIVALANAIEANRKS